LCKSEAKHERFVVLLTALCSCLEEAIPSNQEDIITYLFGDEAAKSHLIMPIRLMGNEIEVFVDEYEQDSQWVSLVDLKSKSKATDQGRIYKYFVSFVDLAAELCFQRNMKGIEVISEIFAFETVFIAIKDPNLEFGLKSKFVK